MSALVQVEPLTAAGIVAGLALIAMIMALVLAVRPGGSASSTTVQRINRRAAWILSIAAVVLAAVMAGIAVKPALLGILGWWLGTIALPMIGAAYLCGPIRRLLGVLGRIGDR